MSKRSGSLLRKGSGKFCTERHLMDWTIIKSNLVSHAVILGLDDGRLIHANHPPTFVPPEDTVDEILSAYEGKMDGLAKHGILLGHGIPVNVPAKIYEKMLYGSDGQGGGCVCYKSDTCLLILVYPSDPAAACRLATQAGAYLTDQGL